ncbi:hypothetical protein GLOIN_2v1735823 [Rhizophagus irregularis DAOM 181602=DAOM 197198]|nr:hypothetical protein GLOIN_2v1735823 [Rhizophagus irregularis DAOM 181602=DAOM 197198]
MGEIGDYWTEKPPKRHIHVIVKLPLLSLEEALSCIPPPITYSPDCVTSKTTTKAVGDPPDQTTYNTHFIMSSELEVLKQRIIELEAENAEIPDLRRKISEFDAERVDLRRKLSVSDAEIAELKRSNNEFLRANKEYNERRDAENAKLRATIEELKSENIEVRDRLTKVEQRQRRKRWIEKKLSKAEQASLNQDQESDTGCSTSEKILEVFNPVTKISAGAPGQNSHRKKGAENIVQLIADGIKDDAQSSDKAIPCDVISIESLNQNSSTDSLLSLAQLFDKADDAEYGAIRANQEEILRWYYYGKEFLTQVSVIVQDGKGKIGEKKAKGIIYDKMLEHLSMLRKQRSEETGLRLPEISRKNLQRKTQKAVKIYIIFEKIS